MAKQSRGQCSFCGYMSTKGGITRHLATCKGRTLRNAEATISKRPAVVLWHLRVEAVGLPQFWLDLEVKGDANLGDLDAYLRRIWLECCGHLSTFYAGGDMEDEIPMTQRVNTAFTREGAINHIYDFGSSSETLIKAVGKRKGVPLSTHPLFLMARNEMPLSECIQCGKLATLLCDECLIEDQVWGTLCEEHAKTHPHQGYGEPHELYNSPRMGVCGYDGPAEPPY